MKTRLIQQIRADGPMPFDAYMEVCLYDPEDGFFAAGPVRSGKKGDFVTSPEISWAFGVPVGEWAEKHMPSDHAVLIEIGAGSGALMEQLYAVWTQYTDPVYAIERSAEARERLTAKLRDVIVFGSIGEIPKGIDAVVIANEVLDNMPAALARRVAGEWMEIAVSVVGDDLVLVDVPGRVEVLIWCDETFGEVPDGTVVSVQLAVGEWISQVFGHFGKVSMCVIDYGGTSDELAVRDPSEVVRTYRKHQAGLDWLQHPGETDITVDVNVNGVLRAITRAGREARLATQREFCLAYGLDDVINDAIELEHVAARAGDVMSQLQNRSQRLDMEALIDPTGLGTFKVILVE